MIRFTTHRAILDWWKRPTTVQNADPNSNGARQRVPDDDDRRLPGVAGMTKHRLVIELPNKRLADAFGKVVADALADPALHEAKRGAIEATKRQLDAAVAAVAWP